MCTSLSFARKTPSMTLTQLLIEFLVLTTWVHTRHQHGFRFFLFWYQGHTFTENRQNTRHWQQIWFVPLLLNVRNQSTGLLWINTQPSGGNSADEFWDSPCLWPPVYDYLDVKYIPAATCIESWTPTLQLATWRCVHVPVSACVDACTRNHINVPTLTQVIMWFWYRVWTYHRLNVFKRGEWQDSGKVVDTRVVLSREENS